jgi:hypothetical protein
MLLELFPVTALVGPRQCGKTTLAGQITYDHYFDLENPRDLAVLDHPQLALEKLSGLIVIDEIQRKPDLFPLLRYLVDTYPHQKYLILGSTSRHLMQQSSESLAGRIGYYHLSGFRIQDVGRENLDTLWLRGGLPRSYLADREETSRLWRENYITTFLERDIPQLGIHIPAATLRRFWLMVSHYHGQILNYAELGRSFGISDMTVRKYIDILEATFMLRVLRPWQVNIGKRLVKQPKLYLRDSGIFHTLQAIDTRWQLFSHPKLGASWEGFALEHLCRQINKRDDEVYFWRTHNGAELDLFWRQGGKNWGAEFKFTDAPHLSKAMVIAMQDLQLETFWVIYPGDRTYPLAENIIAMPLQLIHQITERISANNTG